MKLRSLTPRNHDFSKMVAVGLLAACMPTVANSDEIVIDENADFALINGGYSDGTADSETIILKDGVIFSAVDDRVHAIYSSGENSSLQNRGTILASGDHDQSHEAAGIRFEGNHGTLTNFGTIQGGTPAVGMKGISGIVSGETTSGEIGLSGNQTGIKNSGNIYLNFHGDDFLRVSSGIAAYGFELDIENDGVIDLNVMNKDGVDAMSKHGIYVRGPYGVRISNTGTITTTGVESHGIVWFHDSGNDEYGESDLRENPRAMIYNSGDINAVGGGQFRGDIAQLGAGIRVSSWSNERTSWIMNTGRIVAHTPYGTAIYQLFGKGTIINAGLLKGEFASITIDNRDLFGLEVSGDSSVHLMAGSVLIGDVIFARGNTYDDQYTLTFGPGLNAVVRHRIEPIEGFGQADKTSMLLPHEVKAPNNASYMSEDSVYAVDLTTEQTARQAMITSLGRNIVTGLAFSPCGGGIGEHNAGDEGALSSYWTQPFGSPIFSDGDDGIDGTFNSAFNRFLTEENRQNREFIQNDPLAQYDPGNAHAAFEGGQVGNMFGFCDPFGSFRLFAGFTYGWVETSDSEHFESKSFGAFAGISGDVDTNWSYAFTAGYLHHETDHQLADNRPERTETGLIALSDDYGTLFFMPSLSYAYAIEQFDELSQAVLRVRYLGTLQTERTINLDDEVSAEMDQSFAHELSARAELHAPLLLANQQGSLRLGAEALWNEGEYELKLGGKRVADVSAALEEFTARGFVGANIGSFAFEVGYDNNEIFDALAALRFEF